METGIELPSSVNSGCLVEEGMALLTHPVMGANVSTIRHLVAALIHVGVLTIHGLRSAGKGLSRTHSIKQSTKDYQSFVLGGDCDPAVSHLA